MPVLRIKVNSPILPILTQKLVAMATSLEPSEKGGQIGNLRSGDHFAEKFILKKKLMQAEHISRGACVPHM